MLAGWTRTSPALSVPSSLRTGRYLTVTEIKLRLHEEGYSHGQIDGPLLKKQLMDAIADARRERATQSKIGKA